MSIQLQIGDKFKIATCGPEKKNKIMTGYFWFQKKLLSLGLFKPSPSCTAAVDKENRMQGCSVGGIQCKLKETSWSLCVALVRPQPLSKVSSCRLLVTLPVTALHSCQSIYTGP